MGISYDVISGFMNYVSSACLELSDVTEQSVINAMEESLNIGRVIKATNTLRKRSGQQAAVYQVVGELIRSFSVDFILLFRYKFTVSHA